MKNKNKFFIFTAIFFSLSCNGNLFNNGLNVPVKSVSLNKASTIILIGYTEQLTATIEPADATDRKLEWESDNPDAATVSSDGLVTAVNPGSAKITVTTSDGGYQASCEVAVERFLSGQVETYATGEVSFNMIYVQHKEFYINTDDSGSAAASKSYWTGDTEVSYKLWSTVYSWATTDAGDGKREDGGELYEFGNEGVKGNDGDALKTTKHPVTCINWCDSIVWCNAATEWYNAEKGTDMTCVYTYAGTILRDSTFTAQCEAADSRETATGFRLLASDEWELAARYISDSNNDGDIMDSGEYYSGNHASGDTSGYCEPEDSGASDVFGDYAWYVSNSGDSTHEAAAKSANNIGLYDMSGNVWEWCFDLSGSERIIRGGGFDGDAGNLQVGFKWSHAPWSSSPPYAYVDTGFRIGKNE